jgi:hypothetical protein
MLSRPIAAVTRRQAATASACAGGNEIS